MSTLLEQIRDQAVESGTPIGDVLRRCKVLSVRLGDAELEQWVTLELNGYPMAGAFPEYRIVRNPQVKGHFSGIAGSMAKGMPISRAAVPEEFRSVFDFLRLGMSAAAYEKLLAEVDKGHVEVPWPADILGIINQFDMSCVTAFYVVSTSQIRGVLETVRNKILNYVLEIEKRNPDAGEPIAEKIPREVLHQVFTNNITGNVGNIAAGSTNVTQHATINVNEGDFESLAAFIRSHKVEDAEIEQLREAVAAEPPAKHRERFGPRVLAWIGQQTARFAVDVPPAFAAEILVRALMAFYGHHSPV